MTTRESIIFDDWAVRVPGALERREKSYRICMALLIASSVFGAVVTVFYPYAAIALVSFLAAMLAVHWQWLKMKRCRLMITDSGFAVTDRFGKIRMYKVEPKACRLELEKHWQLGGGIYLTVYNAQGKKLFRYEDMLNNAAGYQEPQTAWEKAVRALGMELVDKEQLLKN